MYANQTIVHQRLLQKGKGILESCLENGSTLCIQGFVDHQINKGEMYVPVVHALAAYVECRILGCDARQTDELIALHSISDYIHRALNVTAEQLRLSPLEA